MYMPICVSVVEFFVEENLSVIQFSIPVNYSNNS